MSCEHSVLLDLCGGQIAVDPDSLPPSGTSYSLEETWTGGYWIDGKKSYQKTISHSFNGSGTQLSISHLIENLNECIDFFGVWFSPASSTFQHLPFVAGSAPSNNVQVSVTTTEVKVNTGTNVRTGPFAVTIQYTCTNR